MLNNANVLIKRNPEEASKVLFKLEDLLRYQINDSSRERVSYKFIGNEKKYLNECIDTTFVSSVGAFVDRFEHDMAVYTLSLIHI